MVWYGMFSFPCYRDRLYSILILLVVTSTLLTLPGHVYFLVSSGESDRTASKPACRALQHADPCPCPSHAWLIILIVLITVNQLTIDNTFACQVVIVLYCIVLYCIVLCGQAESTHKAVSIVSDCWRERVRGGRGYDGPIARLLG